MLWQEYTVTAKPEPTVYAFMEEAQARLIHDEPDTCGYAVPAHGDAAGRLLVGADHRRVGPDDQAELRPTVLDQRRFERFPVGKPGCERPRQVLKPRPGDWQTAQEHFRAIGRVESLHSQMDVRDKAIARWPRATNRTRLSPELSGSSMVSASWANSKGASSSGQLPSAITSAADRTSC